MIVRITRILLLFQLVAALGIAAAIARVGKVENEMLALAMGFATVVLVRLLITANNFRLSWLFRSETPVVHRLSRIQACRLFLGEFRATMIASSVTMPFFGFESRIVKHSATLPVLLVHGYGCNSGYWHSMSKALLRAGISHRAISMEPVTSGIDEYVPLIHQALERLRKESGSDKVVIVAHSMGGLAARAYLREHGLDHIARVITLGTPHRGTVAAHYGVGKNCRQMHWTADGLEGISSAWLQQMAATESAGTYARFVSIYSHHDNIIAPQTSSHLPGAANIELSGIGHVALATDPTVQTLVIEEVRKASAPVAGATATPIS